MKKTTLKNLPQKIYVTVGLFLLSVHGEIYAQSSNTTVTQLEKGLSIGAKSLSGLVATVALIILGFKFYGLNKDQQHGDEGKEIGLKFVKILVGCAIIFGAPDLVKWLQSLSQGNG